MARETYAALQAKIEKEINKLQKKAEVLQTKRRKPVISSIIASMREYDITPKKSPPPMALARSPLVEPPAARPAPRPPRQRRQTRRCAQVPSSPNRGDLERSRQGPRWLAAEEAAGAARESFLIKE